jgi:2,3-bisphosphoglycerate-independent phosphoglycerate mutase
VKFVIVYVDGLADLPVPALDHRTPLDVAVTPALDEMAEDGVVGRLDLLAAAEGIIPENPLFALLGGDVRRGVPGRGGLEAFATGLPAGGRGRVASARLVSQLDGRLTDLTGGNLRDAEARLLVESLNGSLGAPGFELVHLRGNRLLLLLGEDTGGLPVTTPPECCVGQALFEHLPRGPGGERLAALVRASAEVLDEDPVNRVRCDLGENPANLLWVSGVADLPLDSRWLAVQPRKGTMVTEELWPAGMAMAFGLDPQGEGDIVAEDTAAVGRLAVEALEVYDLVIAHVGEPGLAALAQEPRRKVACIEELDRRVIAPIRERLAVNRGRLAVVSAWTGASGEGAIVPGFSPFLLWGLGAEGRRAGHRLTEHEARSAHVQVRDAAQFREFLFSER